MFQPRVFNENYPNWCTRQLEIHSKLNATDWNDVGFTAKQSLCSKIQHTVQHGQKLFMNFNESARLVQIVSNHVLDSPEFAAFVYQQN